MKKKICMICHKKIVGEEPKKWYGVVNKKINVSIVKYTHDDCTNKRQLGVLFGKMPEVQKIKLYAKDVTTFDYYGASIKKES